MSSKTVRVGILVERYESKYNQFRYYMFHCRQRDNGDGVHVATRDWIAEAVSCMGDLTESQYDIPVGGSRRYWVHMTVEGWFDYLGEYDEDITLHSVKVCGKINTPSKKRK